MDISALGATAQTSSAAKSAIGLADSFDTFLTLLTTQLKYQDPLEPMDSTEFTNQLVQFTEVEQSISTNKQLEQLLGMQATNQSVAALGYIGKTVEAEGTSLPLIDGEASLTYTLPENADNASVLIFNEAGQLVRTVTAEKAAGKHSFTWDGKASTGATMPDGVYTVAISAQNAEGATIKAKTGIIGKVTGTETGTDGVLLSIGPAKVALDKVVSVAQSASDGA